MCFDYGYDLFDCFLLIGFDFWIHFVTIVFRQSKLNTLLSKDVLFIQKNGKKYIWIMCWSLIKYFHSFHYLDNLGQAMPVSWTSGNKNCFQANFESFHWHSDDNERQTPFISSPNVCPPQPDECLAIFSLSNCFLLPVLFIYAAILFNDYEKLTQN